MAQELTIQHVEGMTKAVDKMSTAFRGLKSSIGTIKGTNALKELQAAVGGINRLDAAIQSMDKGIVTALGKVVARLDELPRAFADTMGSSARAVREGTKKVGDAAVKGAKEASDKLKAAKAQTDAEFYSSHVKAYKDLQEVQIKADAQMRKAQSSAEAARIADRTKTLGSQRRVDQMFEAAQAAHANRMVAEQQAQVARQAAVDRQFEAARLRIFNANKALYEAQVQKQQSIDRQFEAALADHERKKLELRETALDKQRRVDRAFEAAQMEHLARLKAAQDKAQVSSVRASVGKAMQPGSIGGAFSTFSPNSKSHGQLNEALDQTAKKSGQAGLSLQKLGIDANTAHSAVRGLASGFNLLWLTWGELAPLLAGAAISNAFVQTMKLGVQVNATLEQMRVLGQETTQAMDGLNVQMLQLAERGPFGLNEIAQAMKTLTLAGLDAKDVFAALPTVLDFSVAGDTDIKMAAEVITSVGTAFRLSAKEYSIVGDTIAKAAAVSKASVEDMSEAFKASTVVHKQYGASLNDVALGLALLSNLGVKGSAAGTALRNMYVDLAGRTDKVSKLMQKLGIEVIDKTTGKFYDLVTVARNVSTGLDKLSTEAEKLQARNILLSERGMKPVIELLDQFKTKGQSAATALDDLAAQVADKAGFMGLAAANLALTNANQIKSVFTTLQASAYEAFKNVEPLIFGMSRQLREAFKSEGFKTALSNLMVLLGNLTSFLVEHGRTILYVAGAYATLKTAQFATSFFAGLAGTLANAATGLIAMRAAAAGTGPALATAGVAGATFATTATTIAARSATATAAMTGFLTVGSRVLGFLAGPWGLAMTAAIAAYTLYTSAADKAAAAKDKFSGEKSKSFVEGLNERTEQVKLETAAIRNKEDAATANEKANANKQLADTEKSLAAAEANLADKRKGLKTVTDQFDKAEQTWQKERLSTRKNFHQGLVTEAQTEVTLLKARAAAEKAAADAFISASREKEKASAEAAAEEAERVRKLGLGGTITGVTGGDDKAGTTASNELSQIKQRYADRAQALKSEADREAQLLKSANDNKLIDDAVYNVRLEEQTRKAYAQRIANISSFEAQFAAAVEAAKAKTKDKEARSNIERASTTFKQEMKTDRESALSEELQRQKLAANEAAGALKKLEEGFDTFWSKVGTKQGQKSAIEQMVDDLGLGVEAAKTFSDAAAGAARAYVEELAKTEVILEALQAQYDAVAASIQATRTPGEGGMFEVSEAELDALANLDAALQKVFANITKLKGGIQSVAAEAGSTAVIGKFLKSAGDETAKSFDSASRALSGFVNSVQKLTEAWKDQSDAQAAAQKNLKEALKLGDPKKEAGAREDVARVNKAAAQQDVRNYGNIAAAAKNFFKQGSTGYKTLHAAEKAFRMFELAMSIKSTVQKAFETTTKVAVSAAGEKVLTATTAAGEAARNLLKIPGVILAYSSQLGPWGTAAAIALIAALGFGAAKGGKSSGGFTGKAATGTGTVMGDTSAKSESIQNSIEKLEENSSIELTYSAGMLSALKNIEASIGGVTNLILRGNVDGDAAGRLGVSNSQSMSIFGKASTFGDINPLTKWTDNLLFGGKTTVKGSGLLASAQTLGSIMGGGLNLQEYADVNTTKKFLGIKYSNKDQTVTGAADPALSQQFGLIFKSFYEAIKLASVPLGQNLEDVTSRLDDFVVDIGRIDLQGLTGEEIQEKLGAVLGAAADTIAQAALPGFADFQKVGEGYFETVVRVANASEFAKNALGKLGIQMVGLTEIARKQGDVTVELLRASIVKVEEVAGLPMLTGVGKIIQAFEGAADELLELYDALLKTRESLKSIGKDWTTLSLEMIKAAGGLDALKDGIQSYYDNFLTEEEKVADMTRRLTEQFGKAGVAMPGSVEGFRNLIKGIDTSTVSGQELFGRLIVLSGSFYDLQEAINETETTVNLAAQQREDLLSRLTKAEEDYAKATMTTEQYAARQKAAIDASNHALYDQILTMEAATAAANKAASERQSLQDELNSLTLTEVELLALKRAALEESNRALFDQIQATKAAAAVIEEAAKRAERVASQRYDLETRVLELQGNTAELRARELAKLEPENRELQIRIWALEDGTKAQEAANQAAEEAASAAERAAEEAKRLKEAWQDVANSIAEEIRRIKGIAGGPKATTAIAQSEFAIATAKARSGDVEAAKNLPKLSEALLKLAGESAGSSVEFNIIQARTMASLDRTLKIIAAANGLSIPAYAMGGYHQGGLRLVGERGAELEATGPARIFTANQTQQMLSQGGQVNPEDLAEVRRLLALLVEGQTSYGAAIAAHTHKTARILERVTPEGDAIATREVTE